MEDRSVYGVENSSMFLECSPKSQRALIYWQLQKPNDDRKHEVRPPPRTPPPPPLLRQKLHLSCFPSVVSSPSACLGWLPWRRLTDSLLGIYITLAGALRTLGLKAPAR